MNVVGANLVTAFFVLDEEPDDAKTVKRLLCGADPKTKTIAIGPGKPDSREKRPTRCIS